MPGAAPRGPLAPNGEVWTGRGAPPRGEPRPRQQAKNRVLDGGLGEEPPGPTLSAAKLIAKIRLTIPPRVSDEKSPRPPAAESIERALQDLRRQLLTSGHSGRNSRRLIGRGRQIEPAPLTSAGPVPIPLPLPGAGRPTRGRTRDPGQSSPLSPAACARREAGSAMPSAPPSSQLGDPPLQPTGGCPFATPPDPHPPRSRGALERSRP